MLQVMQVIGLLMVVYGIARLVQVPFEASMGQEQVFGLSARSRLLIVAGVSVAGIIALAVLGLMLGASGPDTRGTH